MNKENTVEKLIDCIEARLSTLCRTDDEQSDETQEQIERDETKVGLLKEWQDLRAKALFLSNQNRFEESDAIDDRCIEIEEHFEVEYDIEFDSFGEVISSN